MPPVLPDGAAAAAMTPRRLSEASENEDADLNVMAATSDPAGDCVFLAVHVPKCAGRTIENHMRKHLDRSQVWLTTRRNRKAPNLIKPLYAPPSSAIDAVRFVSGHYVGVSAERLFQGRAIRRTVLLREPLSFHLSYFNYRMMRYASLGLKGYSFDVHVRSQPEDPIAHFLLSRWLEIPWLTLMRMPAQRKLELLNETLAGFWFVGDISDCDELCGRMSAELGISTQVERSNTKEQWQQKVAWQPLTRTDLTSADIAFVHRRTQLDRVLWETWHTARYRAAEVQPAASSASLTPQFASHELQRVYYSAVRRLSRGWAP